MVVHVETMVRRAKRKVERGEQTLIEAVRRMRAEGWSWKRIGDELGVKPQSAHEKYRKHVDG